MKCIQKFALLTTMVMLLFSSCKETNTFVIEGSFRKTDPTPVRLFLLTEDGSEQIDSVYVNDNTFRMEGEIEQENIYLLKFFNNQQIYLVVRPGDEIDLDIDNSFDEISYYVANSPDSKYIKELFDEQNKILRQIDQLSREFEANPGDSALRQTVDSTYYAIMEEHQDFSRSFIYEHPKSLANILALYQNFGRKTRPLFDKYDDIEIYDFVDSSLTAVSPESYSVIALNKDVTEIKEQIAHKTYIEKKVEVGFPLPQIEAISISGDTLKIPEIPGNYVMIFFWASWNPYSVKELVDLNDLISTEDLLEEDFQIISFSLDTEADKLNAFLEENSLVFPVVCDYNYWDSRYVSKFVIKQLPSVIIADKRGKVIARDIFGQELENFLKETIQ